MENIFLKLLNMSITASYLVIAVVLLRLIFKKAPKMMAVALWALVAVRLICPVSVESILSVLPSTEAVSQDILYANKPSVDIGSEAVVLGSLMPSPADSVNPMQVVVYIASIVWIAGMAAMLLYAFISYLRLHRRIRESVAYNSGIWICDSIDTPFILGLIRPRIYMPTSMNEGDLQYVIAHENAHLRRRDHWWKPLGFALLVVYWYNPVIWLAFILFCRDIEYACDEKVIKEMGIAHKKSYSNALINCSIPRKMINACPLAFGEVGVKSRIKSVLHYKKPAFWIVLLALLASIGVAVCFMTVPQSGKIEDENLSAFVEEQILAHHTTEQTETTFPVFDYEILGVRKSGNQVAVYMWVFYQEYSYEEELIAQGGIHTPTVVTAEKDDKGYHLTEYWTAGVGKRYEESIRDKFPITLWSKALNSERYLEKQMEACKQKAIDYFGNEAVTSLVYASSVDPAMPTVYLYPKDNTFHFFYSAFSSYFAMGTYQLTDSELILTTNDDFGYVYRFTRKGDDFVFNAGCSSGIPSYKYSADGEMQCPVPDGAVFEFETFF